MFSKRHCLYSFIIGTLILYIDLFPAGLIFFCELTLITNINIINFNMKLYCEFLKFVNNKIRKIWKYLHKKSILHVEMFQENIKES